MLSTKRTIILAFPDSGWRLQITRPEAHVVTFSLHWNDKEISTHEASYTSSQASRWLKELLYEEEKEAIDQAFTTKSKRA